MLKIWVGLIALVLQVVLACVGYAQVVAAPRVHVSRADTTASVGDEAVVAQPTAQTSPMGMQAAQPPQQYSQSSLYDRSGGSLLKATLAQGPADANQARLEHVSLYAVPEQKPRTVKRHDLITVIIREQSEVSSDAKTETKRNSDLNARVSEFLKLSLSKHALSGSVLKDPPSLAATAQRNFTGEGTANQSDSLTTRLTCEVVDVKPNGTLVVQGRRSLKVNEEEKRYLVSGMCRAEDVTPDNTILSTQLADFDLRRDDKGAVRDATKRGGAQKFFDWLNPF
jgi:flagellar L-ring protein precursor FlgH